MKILTYILLTIILFYSCQKKSILGTVPNLGELNEESSLADFDLLNSIISYQQYLKIKTIQNSINHGTIHFVNGLTYENILETVSKYQEGEGFYLANYEGVDFIKLEIDTIHFDETELKMNINLNTDTTEQIFIDELILIIEDVLGKELAVNVYNCPIEISKNKTTIFGASINKTQIIESFNKRNFKIEFKDELFKLLNFKVLANKIQDKPNLKNLNLDYYQNPICSSSSIVKKYNPEEEITKYSRNDTLIKTVLFIEKFTCK